MKYKVSVIIPVYNMELYIRETVNSVLNQTLGKENIQVILINDGSTDNSANICKELANENSNILFFDKANSGVSDTRNFGIKYIEGEYVNFLDADDLWDEDAFEKGCNMLESNDDIDLVVFRLKCFEGRVDNHQLDYKFDGDYIVDLDKHYDKIALSSVTVLYRSKLFKKYCYDTSLRIAEDYKLITEILLDNPKYGMISSSCYNYRVRGDNSSAIQSLGNKKEDYILNVKKCHLKLIEKSKKLYGKVIKYLQYSLIYEIQWRLKTNKDVLSLDEKVKYEKLLRKIIEVCEDDIIVEQQDSNISSLMQNFDYKYKMLCNKKFKVKNGFIYFNDSKIMKLSDLKIDVYILEIINSQLKINFAFNVYFSNVNDIYVKINGKEIKLKKIIIPVENNNIISLINNYENVFYEFFKKLDDVSELEFFIDINGKKCPLILNFVKHSKLNNCKYSYYKNDGYLLTHKDNKILVNQKQLFISIKYLAELLLKKKDILSFGFLLLYYITYPFVKHDNWIISDRYDVAGDNAERLYEYIKEHSDKKNIYFGLKKDSRDYGRMSKIVKVLPFKTLNYYLKYMNSEVVISSHIDNYIHKPFGTKQIYLNAFINRKFVFLQHGIIQRDLSGWLSNYHKKIDLFICSAFEEYNSILNSGYMYDDKVVKLTGLPRYDNLLKKDVKKEKIIALMPTWRTNLVGPIVSGTQDRGYNFKFKETDYYKFYNSLITDSRIHKVLNKYNYKILFCLHPSMKGQIKDFETNKYVDITYYVDYPMVFKKAKFMITDYSSVFFDFAYLKKPILYTQFDQNTIINNHAIYNGKGYFEYERDGFGDVVYDYETAVNKIVNMIENDCKMADKYVKRVNKFFKYFDDQNCRRVYENITKMLDRDRYEK